MTQDSLKQLPTPEKKVVAKELMLNGYSSRKVEEILGIDHATAARYAKEPENEDTRQFATIFKNYIEEQKQKGIDLVYKRILELIPREKRIDQVVRAGEYLEGKNQGNNLNILNQGGDMKLEFVGEDK